MSKKILIILSVLVLLVGGLFVACEDEDDGNGDGNGPPPVTKDSIVIGASRPITGPNAPVGDAALGPIMEVWEEKVSFTPSQAGPDQKVEFLLFREGDEEPYRTAYLWIDVTEGTEVASP